MDSEGQPRAGRRVLHSGFIIAHSQLCLSLLCLPTLAPLYTPSQVDVAIYKLHIRRCCTLEFHQTNDSIVISGDKQGGIAIWDFDRVGVKKSALQCPALLESMSSQVARIVFD